MQASPGKEFRSGDGGGRDKGLRRAEEVGPARGNGLVFLCIL